MKKILLLVLMPLLLGGCQNQERELRLQKQEADLAHREQELLLRENALAVREQELTRQAQLPDSTTLAAPADTALVRRMSGRWATRMNCTETDCPGSAIGDSKNEEWEISSEQGAVLVKATVKGNVVRVYSGALSGSTLELTAQHLPNETLPDAIMKVTLQLINDQRLEGRREIERPGACRIVYALELTKAPLVSP